jgi:tetratricopeptide (TPR) repeat protein
MEERIVKKIVILVFEKAKTETFIHNKGSLSKQIADSINKDTGIKERISKRTITRLYDTYLQGDCDIIPRKATIDILIQYLGYQDYKDYLENSEQLDSEESIITEVVEEAFENYQCDLKIALVEIVQQNIDYSTSISGLAMQHLKVGIRNFFNEQKGNIRWDILSSDSTNLKLFDNYDLVISGDSIQQEDKKPPKTIIRYTLPYQNKILIQDYKKEVFKIYKFKHSLFLEDGELPNDIKFISYWLMTINFYFKDQYNKCLKGLTVLELMLKSSNKIFEAFDHIHAEIRFIRAVVYMLKTEPDYEKAEKLFQEITKTYPEQLEENRIVAAKLYHNWGVLQRRTFEDIDVAIASFKKAVEFKEDQWQSYWELGRLQVYKQLSFKKYYELALKYAELCNVNSEIIEKLQDELDTLKNYDGIESQLIIDFIKSEQVEERIIKTKE